RFKESHVVWAETSRTSDPNRAVAVPRAFSPIPSKVGFTSTASELGAASVGAVVFGDPQAESANVIAKLESTLFQSTIERLRGYRRYVKPVPIRMCGRNQYKAYHGSATIQSPATRNCR